MVLDAFDEPGGPHGPDANMNGQYPLPFFGLETTPFAAVDPQVAACGSTGTGGAGGSTGTGGRGGTTGTGGTTGAAGRGGTTGTAGTTGSAGRGGAGGTTGSAGTSGTGNTSGAAGTTGAAGDTGAAGTGTISGSGGDTERRRGNRNDQRRGWHHRKRRGRQPGRCGWRHGERIIRHHRTDRSFDARMRLRGGPRLRRASTRCRLLESWPCCCADDERSVRRTRIDGDRARVGAICLEFGLGFVD